MALRILIDKKGDFDEVIQVIFYIALILKIKPCKLIFMMNIMCSAKLIMSILLLIQTSILIGQTTNEEYNYVTKGFKIQVESGLDMKKGYGLKKMPDTSVGYGSVKREVQFWLLYRVDELTPCATIMRFNRTDTNFDAYICIPHLDSSEDIWKRAFDDFRSATSDWGEASRAYSYGMLRMISMLNSDKIIVSE